MQARARVGMRRRPPTRHKITLGATSVDSSDQDVADFFSNTTSSAINADVMLDKSRIPNHSASIIGKSGKDMPPDLPSSDISVATNQSITVTDTFYDGERVSSKADDLNRTSATIPDNDDIFADGYDTVKPKSNYFQSAKPLFMDKHAASKPNQPASGPLITDSEAISRPPEPRLSENSSTSRLQTKSTKQNATSGIVDEVDDIFADSVLNKPKLGRIQKTNKDDLFGGSEYSRIDDIFGADDDEDIFGSSSTSTQKVATSGQGRFSKKMEAVSDDDLFGSRKFLPILNCLTHTQLEPLFSLVLVLVRNSLNGDIQTKQLSIYLFKRIYNKVEIQLKRIRNSKAMCSSPSYKFHKLKILALLK